MALADIKQKVVEFLATLQTSSNNLVGLDIGSESVKLLKIKSTEKSNEVENFAIAAIPPGLVTKDEIKDSETVATILKDLFKNAGLSNQNVAVAIPRSSAIIKTISIDRNLNEEDIEARAWVEANRLFPDLVGDIYLDFSIIGTSTNDPGQLDMTLVACRKDQVKAYLETLKLAGLIPKVVDVNVYALERSLCLITPDLDTSALLNLNFNVSTFIVVHNKHLMHAHDQSFDGKRLLTQTQSYLQKKQEGGSTPDPAALFTDESYLAIMKENLISHLRHTIHFFYSSRPNINIKKLVLAGDCSQIPALPLFIQQEVGFETVIANPLSQMTLRPWVNKADLLARESELALCCGLALSKVE